MLAIKVNNEFIDLPADVSLELERNNPFLSDDDIQGEYSLGLTISYTEKNYRLLQFTGNFYKPTQKYIVDAEIYDAGMFRYAGQLVITQHSSNMNNIEQTVWTGFFTIGSAAFLQSIQDVLLEDVDYGGDRSFTWNGADPNSGAGTFWQHIHEARVPNAFPYTFYPIYNDSFASDYRTRWMNKLNPQNNFEAPIGDMSAYMELGNAISLCPAIYLSYLLQQIFANFGWKLSGEILDDTGFKKITIPSFNSIHWTDYNRRGPDQRLEYSQSSPIVFDLADHVPPDLSIGSFLVSIKNRKGWWFYFDSNTKTAYLHSYKSNIAAPVKDWTKYVQSTYTADYSDPDKVYSLVNNIDPADDYPVTLNIDESLITRIASRASLPAPGIDYDGQYYFIFNENSYYLCEIDESTSDYAWHFAANNIGDYTPANADTTIESDISTMPGSLIAASSGANILVPQCQVAGNYWHSTLGDQSWGVRFLFYHGMFPDTDGNNYPYASAVNETISGRATGDWSLPYRHQFGAVNDGTYDYWWKEWLKLLSIQDTRTFTLALPVNELRNFSFSDRIFINNVFFTVASAKETLPYKDLIEMKMKRIY